LQFGQPGEVLGAQVLEAGRPVDALAAGEPTTTLCVIPVGVDADPARAVAGDGLHVELVGLELHGGKEVARGGMRARRDAEAQRNYGQIIGFTLTTPLQEWP
jgi:hypothetical protein